MGLSDLLRELREHQAQLAETVGGGPPRLRAPHPLPADLLAAARAHRDVLPALLRLAEDLGPTAAHLLAELCEDRLALGPDMLASLGLRDAAGLARRVADEFAVRGEQAAAALVAALYHAEVRCATDELVDLEAP